jgi:ABC-type dipeptide/oligopeptide/nickel transport system permease component
VFVIMRVIPGDGIDQPLIVQFGTWLWGVLRFAFGTSLWTGRPVIEELLVRLPLSLELALGATVVSVIETSLTHSASCSASVRQHPQGKPAGVRAIHAM